MEWYLSVVTGLGIGALIAPLWFIWLYVGVRFLDYPVRPNSLGSCIHLLMMAGSAIYCVEMSDRVALALRFPNWAEHFSLISIMSVMSWAIPYLTVAIPMVARVRGQHTGQTEQETHAIT